MFVLFLIFSKESLRIIGNPCCQGQCLQPPCRTGKTCAPPILPAPNRTHPSHIINAWGSLGGFHGDEKLTSFRWKYRFNLQNVPRTALARICVMSINTSIESSRLEGRRIFLSMSCLTLKEPTYRAHTSTPKKHKT